MRVGLNTTFRAQNIIHNTIHVPAYRHSPKTPKPGLPPERVKSYPLLCYNQKATPLLSLRSHCALRPSLCSTPPQTGLTTLISIFPAPLLSLATPLYRLIILGWPCRPPWSMFWLKFTQDYQLSVATGSRNEEFEIQFQALSQLAGITVVCTPPDGRQGLLQP